MKRFYLIVLSLAICIIANAQTSFGFREGTIIKKNGDTIRCYVEVAFSYENRVNYKFNQSDDANSLKIKDIKYVTLTPNRFENIQFGKRDKLMKIIEEGKISLYKYVEVDDRVTSSNPGSTFKAGNFINHFVIKKDEFISEVTKTNFKKNLQKLFGDCENLSTDINKGAYEYDSIEVIVKAYNDCKL